MDYSASGTELGDLVAQAVDEYLARLKRGESPALDEFVERYPEIGHVLETLIPALNVTQDCDDSANGSFAHGRSQIGDFRILRQLGRGGMGIVYEAEQISMSRRVALKVLPLTGLVDEVKIRRFQNEVRAVAALNHPNIVPVYTISEERGVHYYAMQLIAGRSLAEVIDSLRHDVHNDKELDGSSLSQITRSGRVADRATLEAAARVVQSDELAAANLAASSQPSESSSSGDEHPNHVEKKAQADSSTIPHSSRREYYRSVASLGLQAATALQHAHDEGVVHRDIKPANLLLDSSTKLYVTDFGLARIESAAGVTMTGDLIGTLRYMAPEQALGKHAGVDCRVDVYSLGVTLYELLALRPAYPTEDRQQLLKQIAIEEPTRLRRIAPDIPAELETIVHKAMSKDMDQRYASAQELADDLRSHLENRPIKAQPPTISEIVGKWTRRNPALTWSAIIALMLVTVILTTSMLVITEQRNVATQMAKRAQEERYVSDMNLASHAWNAGDLRRTQELLTVQRALASESVSGGQGFIWRLLWSLSYADEAAWKLVPSMGAVNWVALSPTSNELAWGGADGSVNIVDSNGRRRQLRSLDSSVVRLAYSIDARWMAAAGDNGNIRLWEAGTWQEVSELQGHKGLIREMLFHPDGTHLTSVDDQEFRIWDLNDIGAVRVVDHPEPSENIEITVSADATTAATYGGLNNTVRIWRLRSGALEPKTLPPQRAMILSSVLSSDGSTAYISTHDSGLSRWDVETLRRKVSYSQDVLAPSLAMSLDGQILVSTGEDNLIRIWEAESGRQLQTVRGHPGRPSNVAIGADSAALAVVSGDGRLIVRSIQAEDRDDVLLHKGIVVCLAVSPDGQTLATTDPHHYAVKLWDMPGGELIGSIDGKKQNVAFSPDGKWLALMSFDGQLQLWDRSTPLDRLQTIGDLGSNPVTVGRNLTFSHDSKMLAFSGKNGTVIVWDVEKREVIHSFPDHSSARPVAFGAYDKVIATASGKLVRIWDVSSGRLLAPIQVRGESRGICFSPNGKLLAAASGDAELDWWDVSDPTKPRELASLQGHTAWIKTVAFSPDGTLLATGGNDNTLRLWDVALGRQLAVLRGHASTLERLAWSPDGNTIYTGSGDATCRIWHAPSWTEIEATEARQKSGGPFPTAALDDGIKES